jgi:hypothetical protein
MLNAAYAECLNYALYAECHYVKCRYAEYRYAECHGATGRECSTRVEKWRFIIYAQHKPLKIKFLEHFILWHFLIRGFPVALKCALATLGTRAPLQGRLRPYPETLD